MLKVFLVEDESVVRESLRDHIPWQQYGYQFAGEAGDGEMALPMIRKTQPDVLITDIRMPFMDGLALSHIVGQEFPDMKIIILSGYDDFEYARRAIREGVEQYLLKPITRGTLQKTLAEVREKIEAEQKQKACVKKFQSEMREYEHLALRNFFEKVFARQLSVQEIYEEAQKHSLDINAPCYNLVLVSLQDNFLQCEEAFMRYFMRFSDYLLFRWNINTYLVMVKGGPEMIVERTRICIEQLTRICEQAAGSMNWYIAAGAPVERFSLLAECYSKLNQIFSCRFFAQNQHLLTEEVLLLNTGFTPLTNGDCLECPREEVLQPDTADVFREKGKTVIKKALEYIEVNYTQEELSLNNIARAIKVSPNYFSAMFSQEMGMTFIEYVTEKRIEKAKELLKETKMPSGDIAAAIGYKDPHYFSFVFKKTQGCTPREYRSHA